MDKESIVKGTIDNWQIYGDKDNNLFILGMFNHIVTNTSKLVWLDIENKMIMDINGNSYRLGKPFNSYQIAHYRLVRGREVFNKMNHNK